MRPAARRLAHATVAAPAEATGTGEPRDTLSL
jgi:hypothetical protein